MLPAKPSSVYSPLTHSHLLHTPEFLAWSIAYHCPVRGFQDGSDPDRTERQLRAVRAYSDALRQGRVLDDLAVDPPLGFRISEALHLYGGQEAVEATCGACPANAISNSGYAALAGCYGVLPLPHDPSPLYKAIDGAIEELGIAKKVEVLFPATRPQWYGIWMGSTLKQEQQKCARRVFSFARMKGSFDSVQGNELIEGLATAERGGFDFHARLYPRGRLEDGWWRLASHCPRCMAAWPAERSRQCRVCKYAGSPAPDKKRRARGQRPFQPLERILGPERAREFLARYEAHRRTPSGP